MPESSICPSCSSPEQHSNFCTDCGADITSDPDTAENIPIFAKILLSPISIIFFIIRSFVGIASVVLVLGMFFGMFMFIFAMMAQGNDGLFPWQRGQDTYTSDRLNEVYGECKDESSSLSLVFFNINTDQNRMRQCLVAKINDKNSFYMGYTEGKFMNRLDIPTEFKKILVDETAKNIAEISEELESRITSNPSIFSEDEVILFVNNWILSNFPNRGKGQQWSNANNTVVNIATQLPEPPESYKSLDFKDEFRSHPHFDIHKEEQWRYFCGVKLIEGAKWNGWYWEFGEKRQDKAGIFYEKTKDVYIDIHPECDVTQTLNVPDSNCHLATTFYKYESPRYDIGHCIPTYFYHLPGW